MGRIITNLIEIDLTITVQGGAYDNQDFSVEGPYTSIVLALQCMLGCFVALNYPCLYTKKGLKCLREPPPFVSLPDFFMWELRGFRRCLRCRLYLWDQTLLVYITQVIGWLGSHKQVLFTSE